MITRSNIITDIKNTNTIAAIHDLEKFAKIKWGVEDIDLTGLDANAMQGTFAVMDRAIERYPELRGTVKSLKVTAMFETMTANLHGSLRFDSTDYANGNFEIAKQGYANYVELGIYPTGTALEDAGVHELGHMLEARLVKERESDWTLQKVAWEKCKHARRILDSALKRVNLNERDIAKGVRNAFPMIAQGSDDVLVGFYRGLSADVRRGIDIHSISKYATANASESFAEAFKDVVANGDNASGLSKAIMREYENYRREESLTCPCPCPLS